MEGPRLQAAPEVYFSLASWELVFPIMRTLIGRTGPVAKTIGADVIGGRLANFSNANQV